MADRQQLPGIPAVPSGAPAEIRGWLESIRSWLQVATKRVDSLPTDQLTTAEIAQVRALLKKSS